MTFLGGASEVGGSSTLLKVAGRYLLIDGGMRPAARDGQSRIPELSLLAATPPEALLITHAHIDHTGALPLIASIYPHIPIYVTESTRVLTEILLRDAVRIMKQEGLHPDGETPLYNKDQVDALLSRMRPIGFRQSFTPIASAPEIRVHYLPAGHILGAGILYFDTPEGSLLHTGDISVTDQRSIQGLDLSSLPHADIMICEGTYGNRNHSNRRKEERTFAEAVQQTLMRNGRVLCPAFAVGRAQEIVLILKSYRSSGLIPPVPIYLDGMVRSVCLAYQHQIHDLHPNVQRYIKNARRPLFVDPDLHIFAVRSQERAALIASKQPAIIISSSGMLSGGASPLYAATIAKREQDALLLTGYQDEESPGAALLHARRGHPVQIGSQTVQLACKVEKYNLAGHADSKQISQVVTKVAPHVLILVHGAPDALAALEQRFRDLRVEIPVVGSKLTFVQPSSRHFSPSPQEQAVVPSADDASSLDMPVLTAQTSAPAIISLWMLAKKLGPLRFWSVVELGQAYYGVAYRPSLRPVIEQLFKYDTSAYFKRSRIGSQSIYQPCETVMGRSLISDEEILAIQLAAPLSPPGPSATNPCAGAVAIVQGQKNSVPYLALILSSTYNSRIHMVTDSWKAAPRSLSLLQLLPDVQRYEWLGLPDETIQVRLKQWRQALNQVWVDLFSWWRRCHAQSFSFASLCQDLNLCLEDERLAWGLELLLHGSLLFRRDGETWLPLAEERVYRDAGFAQHLRLLDAGKDSAVLVNNRSGWLTGRSNWRLFEVRWHELETATAQPAQIRASSIHLID
ncbi:MBL fold metallo-hydrolase [Dictyobacter alpinus]|nr:MBL fold metallo-hydrolase [Dictyobacter alpinus]